jgi:hypothetical protein
MNRFLLACAFVLAVAAAPRAQTPLPVVEDVEWKAFRERTQKLLKALEALKSPLPAETVRSVKGLLEKEEATPQAAEAVQKLLDPYCLVGISINPESRVKAARGPADTELPQNRELVFLIKVQNDAGVTPPLSVSGPQITTADKPEEGRWLKAVIANDDSLPRKLGGQRVEYVVMKLTALEAGKREATLKFDVGQGTQDLGFRAEVPILFRVK